MATKNGNVISGGSTSAWNAYRWYSQLEVTTKSETSTSITYTVKVKYYTQYAINTYANASLSGGVTGSWSGSMYSGSQSGRTVTVITKTDTVSKGGSSKTVSYTAKVQTTGGFAPGTSTAELTVTVPAIDYDAPNAPSACSASRVTDKQSKVTWTNGGTSTTKPRSSTKVERQTDSGSWAQIASVGNSVKNYTDNGISANHRYRYRVRAYGSGGYSGYSTSGYIYTTPKAPSAVSLVKTSDTQVQVSISGAAAWADGYELQRSVDSGSWAAVATVTAWPYTDTPGGGYVRYRVRAKRGTLASAWTESVEIATITPPLAPAVTLDPSGAVQPCGTAVTVAWSPNHPDGSEQSAAQVEYTVGSTAAQTVDVSGSATSYQLPEAALASPATVSVRVRTKGLDPDWGAWSSPVQVALAYPPSVTITSPGSDGAVVDSLPLEIAGLMSELPIDVFEEKLEKMIAAAYEMGVAKDIQPFMDHARQLDLPARQPHRLRGAALGHRRIVARDRRGAQLRNRLPGARLPRARGRRAVRRPERVAGDARGGVRAESVGQSERHQFGRHRHEQR